MSKIVLITGASRGIGAAIAHRFAKESYSLIITCSKSANELFALKQSLEELYHVTVLASVGNIGDSAYVCRLFDEIKDLFGGVDVVINNAGISHIGLLTDTTFEKWNSLIQTNLSAAF